MLALDRHAQGMDRADALHLASSGDDAEFATFDRNLGTTARRLGIPRLIALQALRNLLNLSAPQAARAHQHSLDAAADRRANLFQIRMPSPLGLVVRVADVVADRLMFLANRAVLHDAFFSRFLNLPEMNVLG